MKSNKSPVIQHKCIWNQLTAYQEQQEMTDCLWPLWEEKHSLNNPINSDVHSNVAKAS